MYALRQIPIRVLLTSAVAASLLTPPITARVAAAACGPGGNPITQNRIVVHEPQAAADGARMIWKARALHADDWDALYEGFASQVLWVGTDNESVIGGDFVEVGATHGWEGEDLLTFYSAEVDEGIFHENPLVGAGTPDNGVQYTFRVVYDGSGIYLASVEGPNGTGSVGWGTHFPDTFDYAGGLESTCDTSKVNATYVSNDKFRRKSDNAYVIPNDGYKYTFGSQGDVDWCVFPETFKYRLNNLNSYVCS